MNKLGITKIFDFSKRQKFVLSVVALSGSLFIIEFLAGQYLILIGLVLSLLTDVFLYLIIRRDVKGTFYYPIFILPFLYTLAFVLFYSVIPPRLIARLILTGIYAFGLYSLFLTQNIFAVSGIRTITLLRSARIVSFVLSIVVLFFMVNVAFSLRLQSAFLPPFLISFVSFILALQTLWTYALDKSYFKEITLYAIILGFAIWQLGLILVVWPVTAAIYSIFITGIFYMYSGLAHAWLEKRLFKGILWEYFWVGFLSVLILIVFSDWGI